MADVPIHRRLAGRDTARARTASHPRLPGVLARGFWLVVLANAVFIVVLWARGGNLSGVRDLASLLNSLGRITGLLAGYLLLLQVLLLARLPWLERQIGFDRLTVWHRRNGKLTLYLVLAHVVTITIGYALTDRLSIPKEVGTLLQSYPGMVTATIGTAFLILVVLTSLVIVRRRLRYEAWYLVHLLAYAGIVLGWFHQIPTGNEFITNSSAAAYWTALYLATLVLLILGRFLQPIVKAFWYRLQVADVTVEGPGVVSLRLTGHDLDRLGARAGQFFLWRFLTPNRWWESHPFSLSEAPDGRSLRITVKAVGDFTSHIEEVRPGTRVIAEGPFGHFTDEARRSDRILLIAGGIGITPICALVEEMSGNLVLIYRVIRDEDLVFREELERLARQRGIRLCYVVGDHRSPEGRHLLSSEHLRRLVPDIAEREVYVCGPPAMTDVIERTVQQTGLSPRAIHSERFAL